MRVLTIWSGAIAGLIMILIGSMFPSAFLLKSIQYPNHFIDLRSSWQIPGLLICALACGPKSGVIAAIAYLTIGLFYLPVFQGGGSIGYLLTPEFGYLLGFIPAALVTGYYAQKKRRQNLYTLIISLMAGLISLHISGIVNLLIGSLTSRWPYHLHHLIFNYTIIPFINQLIILPGIALLALLIKFMLITE